MDNVPHIALPIRLTGSAQSTAFAVNQQDTAEEVSACVAAVVSFERGSREEDTNFGIADPTFETRPIDVADIQSAVESYEPRAVVSVTEAPYSPHDPGAVDITLGVSVLQSEDV
jgi:hypothetical protein